jgi:hypothetical protein
MNEHMQAEILARWLEQGGPPPEGLDLDAVEAMIALKPELAPPPTLSVDDILRGVQTGPLASPMPVGASLGASPHDAPAIGESRRRRPWWIAVVGVGGMGGLAAAAMALVVVGGALVTGTVTGLSTSPAPPAQSVARREASPIPELDQAVAAAPRDTGAVGRDGRRDASEGGGAPKADPTNRPADVARRPVATSPAPAPIPAARQLAAKPSANAATGVGAGTTAGPLLAEPVLQDVVAFADEEEATDYDDRKKASEDVDLDASAPGDRAGTTDELIAEIRQPARDVAPVGGSSQSAERLQLEARAQDSAAVAYEESKAKKADKAAREEKEKEEKAKGDAERSRRYDGGRSTASNVDDYAGGMPAPEEPAAPRAEPAPPPPPLAAAPAGSAANEQQARQAMGAAAHAGTAGVNDPALDAVRAALATGGPQAALAACERGLVAHPGNTAVRQELLALRGDMQSLLGQTSAAEASWQAAIAVRAAR